MEYRAEPTLAGPVTRRLNQDSDYLPGVRRQYEEFCYPPRDPEDERHRLVVSHTHWLPLITHYCFGGKFDLRAGGRILVAGSGTGDAEIYLGDQLAGSPAEIVAVDLSGASLEIARKRAAVRGLTNIRWVQASILDLPSLGLGLFDYIACTGVLHHLPDPAAGLAALGNMLAPRGAMGLMVYGEYGRTGVYQMQELLRLVDGDENDPQVRLRHARALLQSLPATNWFARGLDLVHDHVSMGDAGVHDLLLHSQDVAFSVPGVYDLVEGAGLELVSFLHRRPVYDHRVMIPDRVVADVVSEMPVRERQAVAERLSGALTRHFFYCSRQRPALRFDDEDLIPTFHGSGGVRSVLRRLRSKRVASSVGPSGLRQQIRVRNELTVPVFDAIQRGFPVGEIVEEVTRAVGGEAASVLEELRHWGRVLEYSDQLLLRHQSMEAFPPMKVDTPTGRHP